MPSSHFRSIGMNGPGQHSKTGCVAATPKVGQQSEDASGTSLVPQELETQAFDSRAARTIGIFCFCGGHCSALAKVPQPSTADMIAPARAPSAALPSSPAKNSASVPPRGCWLPDCSRKLPRVVSTRLGPPVL